MPMSKSLHTYIHTYAYMYAYIGTFTLKLKDVYETNKLLIMYVYT